MSHGVGDLAARAGATTSELLRRLRRSTPDMAPGYRRDEAERDVAIARAMSVPHVGTPAAAAASSEAWVNLAAQEPATVRHI
jgi:hypothetical protein